MKPRPSFPTAQPGASLVRAKSQVPRLPWEAPEVWTSQQSVTSILVTSALYTSVFQAVHAQREFKIIKPGEKKAVFANPYITTVNILLFLFQFIYYV